MKNKKLSLVVYVFLLVCVLAACQPAAAPSKATPEQAQLLVLNEGESATCNGEAIAGVPVYTRFTLCAAENVSVARYTFPKAAQVFDCPGTTEGSAEDVTFYTCTLRNDKRRYDFYASNITLLDVSFDFAKGGSHYLEYP